MTQAEHGRLTLIRKISKLMDKYEITVAELAEMEILKTNAPVAKT
jgi:hypothetical protein